MEIGVTDKGMDLRRHALNIPEALGVKMCISEQQSMELHQQLYSMLTQLTPEHAK